jgi:diguanylate cyclase (GGDEF)-like protein/PAS domain S-box-containing protein
VAQIIDLPLSIGAGISLPIKDQERIQLLDRLSQAEARIRTLEDQTRTLLDSIHAGIIIIATDSHTIVDVNPTASEIIGVAKQDILGKHCHAFICPAEVGNCPITDKGQTVDNSERILITTTGRTVPILKTVASFQMNGRPHLIESFLDITQIKLLQEKLEYLANTDSITGANNRRRFIHLTETEIRRAERYQSPLSIAMIDIDHFKRINDTYGHLVGDWVLQELVLVLNSRLRPGDILGRLGGEEFAITLIECDLEGARAVSERLREGIAEHRMRQSGRDLSIQISIGVAQLSQRGETWEALLKRADQALYLAKRTGRNRVEALADPY